MPYPAGATSMKLKFSELHSANDWWWAVDNVALTAAKDVADVRLLGVSSSEGTPAQNENLYNLTYTGDPVTATQILDLPSVPDGDAIGFNPATGLLHHLSGGSSTSNDPADPNYRDNHFMETIDVGAGTTDICLVRDGAWGDPLPASLFTARFASPDRSADPMSA